MLAAVPPCAGECRFVRGFSVGTTAGDPDLWEFCGGHPPTPRPFATPALPHPEPPARSIARQVRITFRGRDTAQRAKRIHDNSPPGYPARPRRSHPYQAGQDWNAALPHLVFARRRGAGGVRRNELADSDDRDPHRRRSHHRELARAPAPAAYPRIAPRRSQRRLRLRGNSRSRPRSWVDPRVPGSSARPCNHKEELRPAANHLCWDVPSALGRARPGRIRTR